MPLDPKQIHARRYPRIGEIIGEGLESITRAWRLRSRADQPKGSGPNDESALARVRGFLQSLARQLASTDPEALLPQQRATVLGELRWRQGDDISQVVRDYQTLRLVLIEHLDRELDAPLTRDEWTALSLNIDEAVDAAVSAFSRQETEARNEYQRELEESNRELQRFAHVVAHELKSPLNTQALSMNLLELRIGRENLDVEARRTLQAASDSVEQMTTLINELLRYAEIEAEEDSEPQSTPCDDIFTHALENLTVDITRSGERLCAVNCP